MIVRSGSVTEADLKLIYSIIEKIVNDKECYYTPKEIEELKKDEKNIFIGGKRNG